MAEILLLTRAENSKQFTGQHKQHIFPEKIAAQHSVDVADDADDDEHSLSFPV